MLKQAYSNGMGRTYRRLAKTLKATAGRYYEACFNDPAEVRLLELLGGTTLTIGSIKHKTNGRTFSLILSRGRLLRSEHFKRVASNSRSILFRNDIDQILAIQSEDYERDIVAYQEQTDALLAQGFRVKYIPRYWIERQPELAVAHVKQFIYA